MSALVLKTEQDVADLTLGASFLGIGGGGTAAEGLKLLNREIAVNGELKIVPYTEVPDDTWTVTVSFMGNRAPLTEEQERQKKTLGLVEWKYENNLVEAVRFIQEVTGKKIGAVIVPELGGANTPGPLSVCANLGLLAVDGDYGGRAVPEIAQCGIGFFGHTMTPVASVDKWGNKAVVHEIINERLGERIGKMLAMAAFGNTAIALYLVSGKDMKQGIVPGTISQSFELGKAIRKAREAGKDVPGAIIAHTGGKKLFSGVVSKKEWAVVDGYYDGYHEFTGEGDFSGRSFKTWFRNETHVSWLDDKPYVTTPDFIGQVESSSGQPLLNNEVKEGDRMTLIGMPSRPFHLQPNILPHLSPRHYGFDIGYTPIDTL